MDTGIRAKVKKVGTPRPRTVITKSQQGGRFEPPAGAVEFDHVQMRGVDFSKQKFDFFSAAGATFEDCDFRHARLVSGIFSVRPQSVYRRTHFDGIDLRGMDTGQAKFEQCTFDDVRIEGWFSFTAEFVDCRFSGKIVQSKFSGRVFGPGSESLEPPRAFNEFHGNDFSKADLVDTSFVMGLDMDQQRWPGPPDYVRVDEVRSQIARARAEIEKWPDEKARRFALVELGVLLEDHGDQRALVLRRVNPKSPIPADIQRRVAALLSDTTAN
jgi:hypothetical protein